MKHKNKKNTGVKDTGSEQSAEKKTDNINNNQTEIKKDDLRPRNMLIDYDTNIDDLYQELLKESYKRYPREISMHVIDAREFSFRDIERLSEMINTNKLIVNFTALDCIDFTGLAFFALCVTGEVYFPNHTDIHMESIKQITENELERISKKISNRTGVEANVVSMLYNQKAIVEPAVIFPDDSNVNNIVNITSINGSGSGMSEENYSDTGNNILISEDTDLNQLGKDLIAESNKDNPKKTNLLIQNAKTFKLEEIEKLSKIIVNIPNEVDIKVLKDMNMVELAFSILCNNYDLSIPIGVKIIMDSIVPLSDKELRRISEIIAEYSEKDAEEISEHYKNKDVMDPNVILNLKIRK